VKLAFFSKARKIVTRRSYSAIGSLLDYSKMKMPQALCKLAAVDPGKHVGASFRDASAGI
jgi:hypothetical protein